jgi:hypothetical protein
VTTPSAGPRPFARPGALVLLAHLGATLWLFGGLLGGQRVLYFRDLSTQFRPDHEFLARSLAQGVWPLFNPLVDGGAPCLFAYPFDLLFAGVFGGGGPTGPGVAFHLLVALTGATWLGRLRGLDWLGAWLAGSVYGLSGCVLSCVNLLPLFQAAAWAPWVVAAFLALVERPCWRSAAVLALLGALQGSTLAADIVVQTVAAGLLLAPPAFWRGRGLPQAIGAAVLAGLMLAPVGAGLVDLLAGTERGAGYSATSALQYSAGPLVLAEAGFPRFFGDVHAFSDLGFWGQPFFPQGYPYLISLYLGPLVLGLALAGARRRLATLAALGVLLALGSYGPLGPLLGEALRFLRHPVKFFLLTTLAVALMAGVAVDARRGRGRRAGAGLLAFGGLLCGVALVLPRGSGWLGLLAEGAPRVAAAAWPGPWLVSGLLAVAAGLAAWTGGRLRPLAGLLAVVDLLVVNVAINPTTQAGFHDLDGPLRALIEPARAAGPARWFSYGVSNSPGLHWRAEVAGRGSDAWLYYADRQTLLPRTQELDGLEGIFDGDRTGWAPRGSTLPVQELSPAFFPRHFPRLRASGVRHVLSFASLPADLVTLRGRAPVPGLLDPIGLYEVRDALPRAFAVPGHEVVAEADVERRLLAPGFDPGRVALLSRPPAGLPSAFEEGTLSYERLDPHTARIHTADVSGLVVVLDLYRPALQLDRDGVAQDLLQANGRFLAFVAPGGDHDFTLRYAPAWRWPALGLAGLDLGLCGLLLARGRLAE